MGRDKKAQRSKGNKQPSSSGRTAELLGGATGPVGFSALQDLGFVPAASQGLGQDDSDIPASFRVSMRKMMKKDATTKIKALQEFEALCQEECHESTLSALPFWPRLYGKLSVDVERRVREASQVAHRALVAQVGRQLAPHLRAIMPTWVMAMVDPHTPAATAATKAFQEAFAEDKRAGVVVYTCKEILDHLSDHLFVHTPHTLSDPKNTAVEEMESKHLRLLSSALLAFSWIISTTITTTTSTVNNTTDTHTTTTTNTTTDTTTSKTIAATTDDTTATADTTSKTATSATDNTTAIADTTSKTATSTTDNTTAIDKNARDKLVTALSDVVQKPAFWGLAKHKQPMVRASWFSLLNHLYDKVPQVLAGCEAGLASAILTSLDDPVGHVLPEMWTAFLHLTETHKGWRTEKGGRGATKRIFGVLRDGGRGCGAALYPQLLPLLHILTPGEGGGGGGGQEEIDFYIEFFRALSTGLLKPKVLFCRDDLASGVMALFECLQCVSSRTSDAGLWDVLMQYQVCGLLGASFTSSSQLASSPLYSQVAIFLRFLSRAEGKVKGEEGIKLRGGTNLERKEVEERDKILEGRDDFEMKKNEEEEKNDKEKEEKEHKSLHFSSSSSSSYSPLTIFWEKFLHMFKTEILVAVEQNPAIEMEEKGEKKTKEREWTNREKDEIIGRVSSFLRVLRNPKEATPGKQVRFESPDEHNPRESTKRTVEIAKKNIEIGEKSAKNPTENLASMDDIRESIEKTGESTKISMEIEEESAEKTTLKLVNPRNTSRDPDLRRQTLDDPTEDKDDEAAFLHMAGKKLSPLFHLTAGCQEQNHSIYSMHSTLLCAFPTPGVYAAMLFGVEGKEGVEATPREVIERIILPKMEGKSTTFTSSSILAASVDMFVCLYGHMEEEDKREVLQELKPGLEVSALRLLVERMAAMRHTDRVAADWLLSPGLGQWLVGLVEGLCQGGDMTLLTSPEQARQGHREELTALFNFILGDADREPLVGQQYISEILTHLSNNLRLVECGEGPNAGGGGSQMVELVARLASRLFTSYTIWQTDGIREFLHSLFLLVCEASDGLPKDTRDLLRDTFLHAFRGLAGAVGPQELVEAGGCLAGTLRDIKAVILGKTCSYHLVATLADLTLDLLQLVVEDAGGMPLDCTHVQTLLEHLMPSEGEWAVLESAMSPYYVAPSILQATISFREFPFPRSMQDSPPWDHRHTRTSLFLSHLLLGLSHGDGEEEEVSLGRYTQVAVAALHSTCHATVMMGHASATPKTAVTVSEDVRQGIKKLREDMKELLARLNTGNKRLIAKQIRDRCSDGSSAWCVTLTKVVCDWLGPQDTNPIRLLQGLDEEALGYTATKQALLSLLSPTSLLEVATEEAGRLSSFSEDPFSAPPSVSLLSSALALLPPNTPDLADVVGTIFSVFFAWRERADGVFLFASELRSVVWEDLVVTMCVVRMVSVLMHHHATHLTAQHWDFVLCCVTSWVQSIQDSVQNIQEETVAGAFTCAVCHCVSEVAEVMEQARAQGKEGEEAERFPNKLYEDWREFFAPPLYNSLISIFVEVAYAYHSTPSTLLHGVCVGVCMGVCRAAPDDLTRHNLPARTTTTTTTTTTASAKDDKVTGVSDMKLPATEQCLLQHLCPLLVSPHPAIQGAAYCLLNTVLPDIMRLWDENPVPIDEDDDSPTRPLPPPLTAIMEECDGEDLGQGCVLGTGCELPPHHPTFTRVVGYLLAWKLTLSALMMTSDVNQHQYSAFLRDTGLLASLLHELFRLMPLRPVVGDGVAGGGEDKQAPPSTFSTYFTAPLNITPQGMCSVRVVPQLACSVYYSVVSLVPAGVRQWFLSLERHTQSTVDAFTAAYVTPLLISHEMAAIAKSATKFDNMTVKCRPGAREVVALYTIDEARMELVLRLAPNHPLGTITVEDHKRIGVPLAQWRNWLLGLTTMLSHRNTPLLQSLMFWKQNVDQKFKGLEECYICYYVIHGTNHQLPKLLCRTCKKKFHSACLYKWFSSSNNSTCPLCRSLF